VTAGKGLAVGSTRIQLLGGFEVVVDGAPVPADRWSRRQVATFVKLLALAPGRRLHREQVIDSLWPGVTVREAGPRLHKVAHYARRALDDDGAVLLRNDLVALLPTFYSATDQWVMLYSKFGEHGKAEGSFEAWKIGAAAVVPEPATMLLIPGALLLLSRRQRRA